MSRLYDQIAEHGLHECPPTFLEAILDPATVVVDVSNIADYIRTTLHGESKEKSWIASDFPNIAPPWETAFFEWRSEFSEFRREVNRLGVFVIGTDYAEDCTPDGFQGEPRKLDTEPRWMVSCLAVLQLRGMAPHYMGSFGLLANHTGAVCTFRNSADAPIFTEREQSPFAKRAAQEEGMDSGDLVQLVGPALLGISFMHCKNVATTLNDPPEKVQKKRIRRGKKPLTAYYTLGIEPMSHTLDSTGGAKSAGIKQALHICRGHFATYSPDRPLFGKYSGTFWKPQHVRGSKQHGEIVKDYSVKMPGSNN